MVLSRECSSGDSVRLTCARPRPAAIVEDAHHPNKYRMLLSMVDVVFADVAQPDQARIVALNAHHFLKNGGHAVISIKASCIDSTAPAEAVFAAEVKKLQSEQFKPREQLTLEPYERDHVSFFPSFASEAFPGLPGPPPTSDDLPLTLYTHRRCSWRSTSGPRKAFSRIFASSFVVVISAGRWRNTPTLPCCFPSPPDFAPVSSRLYDTFSLWLPCSLVRWRVSPSVYFYLTSQAPTRHSLSFRKPPRRSRFLARCSHRGV